VEEAVTKRFFVVEADIFFEEEENVKGNSRTIVQKFPTIN